MTKKISKEKKGIIQKVHWPKNLKIILDTKIAIVEFYTFVEAKSRNDINLSPTGITFLLSSVEESLEKCTNYIVTMFIVLWNNTKWK